MILIPRYVWRHSSMASTAILWQNRNIIMWNYEKHVMSLVLFHVYKRLYSCFTFVWLCFFNIGKVTRFEMFRASEGCSASQRWPAMSNNFLHPSNLIFRSTASPSNIGLSRTLYSHALYKSTKVLLVIIRSYWPHFALTKAILVSFLHTRLSLMQPLRSGAWMPDPYSQKIDPISGIDSHRLLRSWLCLLTQQLKHCT